jgi:hypothetical protein
MIVALLAAVVVDVKPKLFGHDLLPLEEPHLRRSASDYARLRRLQAIIAGRQHCNELSALKEDHLLRKTAMAIDPLAYTSRKRIFRFS